MKRVIEIKKDTRLYELIGDIVEYLKINGYFKDMEHTPTGVYADKEGYLILEVGE